MTLFKGGHYLRKYGTYDFIWDIIIGLLATVSLACLAYLAYISYVFIIVLKTLVSKLLKKKEAYEKRKSEKVK